jgi:hypothetical protein
MLYADITRNLHTVVVTYYLPNNKFRWTIYGTRVYTAVILLVTYT